MSESMRILCLLFAIPAHLCAIFYANPALPLLETSGLIRSDSSYSIRAGYMSDYLYEQSYSEEFHTPGEPIPTSKSSICTNAGTLTFNFKNRLDLTAILGTAQLQIDQEVYTESQFAWGIGSKCVLFRIGEIAFGCDVKYFASEQSPLYFLSEGRAYNVVSDFHLSYQELQAAIGLSYCAKALSPYIHGTYLYSKIDPSPRSAVLQIPFYDSSTIIIPHPIVAKRRWGIALGATLLGCEKASLTIESRLFNQNAINISGELRF